MSGVGNNNNDDGSDVSLSWYITRILILKFPEANLNLSLFAAFKYVANGSWSHTFPFRIDILTY